MGKSLKVVLVNYRYFFSGGPERYYFNIKEVLENYGHKVIPFSVKSNINVPSPYDHYFLSKVDDEIYFSQSKKTPLTAFKSLGRMFYSFEARRKFRILLENETPDIVYIMQYHNKISPSIIFAAKKLGVPVVHRISDFQYMCANALFQNETVGVCEKCLNGNKWNAVRYRCVLDSRIYSLIKIAAQKLHELLKVTDKIDAFVVPSAFTISKFVQYGIPQSKLNHIPTFFNRGMIERESDISYAAFALYIGRIERQKGLLTLIKAFRETNYNLKIIGFSNNGYEDKLKDLASENRNIEFLGRKNFSEIIPFLRSCLFTVAPSEIYDNFPNTVIESYAFRKSVVASKIGSLKELVIDGETGILFEMGNYKDLKSKIEYLFTNPDTCALMGRKSLDYLQENYSEELHYEKLITLFNTLVRQ